MHQATCIQEPPEESSTLHEGPVRTILAVDDDPRLLDLLGRILTGEDGYHLLRAESGQEALRLLAEADSPPDLFLLDYSMPGMDGLELFDRLRAQPRYAHISGIMVSACLPPIEDLERRGLVGIQKPYDLDRLISTIEDVLITAHKTPV
jgi:CheY-like chemotaxis protein